MYYGTSPGYRPGLGDFFDDLDVALEKARRAKVAVEYVRSGDATVKVVPTGQGIQRKVGGFLEANPWVIPVGLTVLVGLFLVGGSKRD